MTDKRKMQLVAREGVLFYILEEFNFPYCSPEARAEHRKVLQLLYEETVEEMEKLGLKECKEPRPTRKPGVPSRNEVYKILLKRSKEILGEDGDLT